MSQRYLRLDLPAIVGCHGSVVGEIKMKRKVRIYVSFSLRENEGYTFRRAGTKC